MSSSDVFVLVTAGNCGHCVKFKEKVWPTLGPKIQQLGVRVVEIPLTKMGDKVEANIPQDLNKLLGWYPMMLMADGTAWNAGKLTHVRILNGTVTAGGGSSKMDDKPKYNTDIDGILSWITGAKRQPEAKPVLLPTKKCSMNVVARTK